MTNPFANKEETENTEPVLAAESKISNLKTAVYFASIAVLCILTYFTGGLFFLIGGVLASALFAVTLLRSGEILPKVLGIAVILLMWLITGSFSVAFLLSFLFLPAGLGLAAAFRQRGGMTSAVSASLVFSALFAVPLMLSFMAEFTTAFSINELLNNFGTGFKNILYSAIRMLPEGTYTSFFAMAGIDSAVEFTDLLYARMAFTFPATVCLSLMLMASCAHWVFKQFCLKADLPQMRDSYYFMGKFCFVRISMTASMIYMLCSLLTFLTLENEDAMFFSNLSTIFSYVFAYGGIALVDYFLYRRIKAHPAVRVITGLFLAGLCILPMGISYIVSFVGLADSCWNLRRFITAKEGTVL